ncbi:hypothetical protein GY45DRAFT_142485 [Cubamyces sp. BRFM 1775]|nr:hypothetical protein GY45DRAFT_142485 [Cubamyces sp. BRFM 1775]
MRRSTHIRRIRRFHPLSDCKPFRRAFCVALYTHIPKVRREKLEPLLSDLGLQPRVSATSLSTTLCYTSVGAHLRNSCSSLLITTLTGHNFRRAPLWCVECDDELGAAGPTTYTMPL